MYSLRQTDTFDKWLKKLRNLKARARIIARIRSAELGNLGDVRSVGDGVSEMRVHYGPGYRVYFTIRGKRLLILLVGGDKGTQQRDIAKAKNLIKESKEYD